MCCFFAVDLCEFVVWAGFVVHLLYIRMQLCVIVGFVENITSIFIISHVYYVPNKHRCILVIVD